MEPVPEVVQTNRCLKMKLSDRLEKICKECSTIFSFDPTKMRTLNQSLHKNRK